MMSSLNRRQYKMRSHRMFINKGIRFTPERERVFAAMQSQDEGLGERAYQCLLQLADGAQLHPWDEEWLTDGVAPIPIARKGDHGVELTAHGRLLVDAANRGDVEMMFGLTTVPDILKENTQP